MLKGNHDYWWNSIKKLNEFVSQNKFENIYFLHNNAFEACRKYYCSEQEDGA